MKEKTAVPPVWLCWFSCLGCLASYFWSEGDRLSAAVVSFVAVTGMAGYWLGGALMVAFLAALMTSSLCATNLADLFAPTVGEFFGTRGILNRILATCVGCVAVGFVAMLVFEIVWNRMLRSRGHQGALNQSLGLLLGAIQGAVLSLMILGGVGAIASLDENSGETGEFLAFVGLVRW